MTDQTLHNLSRMNVADFRRFKKALRVLLSANVNYENAVALLVDTWATRTYDRMERRIRRHA